MNLTSNPHFRAISIFLAALITLLATPAPSILQAQDTGTWETLPTGDMPSHRHENAFTRIGDKFYLVGGRGERPVEIYDPATGKWKTGATPPLSMHHFQAVAYDEKLYVLGALNGGYPDETPISHVYIYDPDTDDWHQGPTIPPKYRRGAAGAVAYQGNIYLVAGIRNGHIDGHVRRLDRFNPETGQWKTLPKAPRYRDHFQAAIIDGKLYAAGGRRTSQATGEVFQLTIPEVDVYDFSTGEWTALHPSGDLPTERAGTTSVSVGKHLIVLGGESGTQQPAHAEVEAFNTETGEWESLAPLNQGRHGTQAVVHKGKIHIVAGSKTRGATEINSHEVYRIPKSLR